MRGLTATANLLAEPPRACDDVTATTPVRRSTVATSPRGCTARLRSVRMGDSLLWLVGAVALVVVVGALVWVLRHRDDAARSRTAPRLRRARGHGCRDGPARAPRPSAPAIRRRLTHRPDRPAEPAGRRRMARRRRHFPRAARPMRMPLGRLPGARTRPWTPPTRRSSTTSRSTPPSRVPSSTRTWTAVGAVTGEVPRAVVTVPVRHDDAPPVETGGASSCEGSALGGGEARASCCVLVVEPHVRLGRVVAGGTRCAVGHRVAVSLNRVVERLGAVLERRGRADAEATVADLLDTGDPPGPPTVLRLVPESSLPASSMPASRPPVVVAARRRRRC